MLWRMTFKAFGVLSVVFVCLDLPWIFFVVAPAYKEAMHNGWLATPPRLLPALVFYGVFIAGLVFFVSQSKVSKSAPEAAGVGAFYGLVTYGSYALTSHAVFAPYSAWLMLSDMVWGVGVSAVLAWVFYIFFLKTHKDFV